MKVTKDTKKGGASSWSMGFRYRPMVNSINEEMTGLTDYFRDFRAFRGQFGRTIRVRCGDCDRS